MRTWYAREILHTCQGKHTPEPRTTVTFFLIFFLSLVSRVGNVFVVRASFFFRLEAVCTVLEWGSGVHTRVLI